MKFFTENSKSIEIADPLEYVGSIERANQYSKKKYLNTRNKLIKKFIIGFFTPIAIIAGLVLLNAFVAMTGGFGLIFIVCVLAGLWAVAKEI